MFGDRDVCLFEMGSLGSFLCFFFCVCEFGVVNLDIHNAFKTLAQTCIYHSWNIFLYNEEKG